MDVTGRNDWSSALVYANRTGNHSYFYPSVSGSWLINETFRESMPSWINLAKLRASWAQVGNDTDPYAVNQTYSFATMEMYDGNIYTNELDKLMKIADLKPERKNSWEIGLDFRTFNNRLNLDFTYYKENTTDQIMKINVPAISGVTQQLVNAGNIQNSGIEIALNTTPIKTKDWQWDLDFTYTRNRSKIVSLHPNVANYIELSGYVNAYLAHENGEDGNVSFDALGNIVVDKATKTDGKNAGITLYTDRTGIDTSDKDKVVNTLSALGRKLVYNEAVATEDNPTPEINLDGKVGIAEGLTAGSVAIRLADLDFNKENGEGSLVAGSIHTPDVYVPVMYGSKETAMMKGAKSAMASTAMLWRAENNDLMKRMGDLRLSEGERGLWAKYYGGKYEMDSQNTDFNLKYNAYQLGYDADAGNGWTVGAAVSYNDGDATYGNGRGDLSAYSAGIYGTWKSEDGQYVDIIAKYSKLDNDYEVFNDGGHKLSGDYKTWGTSISAEYGKRFENDNGFYFDPSVELTLGRINGKDYNAHSDYLDSVGVKKDMQVEQDAFNTLVGRVGFRLGQKLDNASYFVKLAAAHEFSGDFDTTFRAVNEPEGRTSIDFGDTWYEAQIGGTVKLSDNSLIYADFERSFGGDVEEKWRVDAGLRFTF